MLIEQSGDLRKAGPAKQVDWPVAAQAALEEGLVVYNARTHRVSVLQRATSRRALMNPFAFTLHPVAVRLHGPTLHRHSISADREIIRDGTYTWEDK